MNQTCFQIFIQLGFCLCMAELSWLMTTSEAVILLSQLALDQALSLEGPWLLIWPR